MSVMEGERRGEGEGGRGYYDDMSKEETPWGGGIFSPLVS